MNTNMTIPTILTIAGSDSGGGAGIQADLKTFTVLGCYGASVIVALTAQNGLGVRGIHAPEPDFARLQLETVLQGFPVAAAKTGMLFSAPIIEVVAKGLKNKNFPLVVDPVAVSQSGHQLLEEDAFGALIANILPLADLLTPNRPEAERLCNMKIDSDADVARAGEKLLGMGAKAVLVKGGHFGGGHFGGGHFAERDLMTDWLILPGSAPLPFSHERVETPNNHGTGCSLSSAIASFLGQGQSLEESVLSAQRYLVAGLKASFNPGLGTGPINFLAAGLDWQSH